MPKQYYVIRSGSTNDELCHHGIKGMKWGVRRFQKKDGSLTSAGAKRYATVGDDQLKAKKQEYKQAKKEYSKAYDSAYKYSRNHPVGQWTNEKKSSESDKRWGDAYDKAKVADAKKSEYKQAKQEYKEVNKEALAARRKRAIKVGVAVAGTALATYGAYKASKYLKSEAGRRSYESGRRYAEEHFFRRADISDPRSYVSLREAGMQTLRNTDRRTRRVSGSTIEAIKYLARPDRYNVAGELI